MSGLIITKPMLRKNCIISPSWIGNGQWMLRREAVGNDYRFKSVDIAQVAFNLGPNDTRDVDDSAVEKLVPAIKGSIAIHRTRIKVAGSVLYHSKKDIVTFDSDYIDWFADYTENLIGGNGGVYVNDIINPIFIIAETKLSSLDQIKNELSLLLGGDNA